MPQERSVGFIINPLAGLGGQAALKGSDGRDTAARALALGAKPRAQARAKVALAQLTGWRDRVRFLTYGGPMGADALAEMGFTYTVLGWPHAPTAAVDTRAAARAFLQAGAELLLFAGGDGTARDICAAVGRKLLVLGIPAGVKMHSPVYALTPKAAGLAALDFLTGRAPGRKLMDVLDIDEEAFRAGRVQARLYGRLAVPALGGYLQAAKSAGPSEAEELAGMAGYVADGMEPGTLYFLGPGSTTFAIKEGLGIAGTLLGVDVVQNGGLRMADATERQLWALLQSPGQKAYIVVTPIGGQGVLFGRGNQQFSPRVLRRVGRGNILAVSTRAKLRGLEGKPLVADTGDEALDRELCGYLDVIVDYEQTVFYKLSDGV